MIPFALLALAHPAPATEREWRCQPAPGIEYRMIVQDEPKRTIFALRFAPGAPYRATSTLARDVVYDLTPSNGRATLTEMTATSQAVGGVNGDFFQFGADPGGDPVGLMVRNGELLSHPVGVGDRRFAYGWGERSGFVVGQPTWKATATWLGGGGTVGELNAYTAAKGLTLSTASAGYAIGKKPTTFVVLQTGAKVLTPKCEVDGTVSHVVEDVEKLRVNPGTVVLSSQSQRDALRGLKPGARVKIRVSVEGFDWRGIDNVMGGGPALVQGSTIVSPVDKTRHPRTAVGRDAQGGVVFAIIDGRQTMSVGATLPETAAIMQRLGCVDAVNLDGGGSSSISLFGLTLNRPSGGVERLIANAVLWHGPRPATASIPLRIAVAGSLAVGRDTRLTLVDEAGRTVDQEKIVWSAQGDAWIEGDGLLHPLKEGTTTVRALVQGRVYEVKLPVAAA